MSINDIETRVVCTHDMQYAEQLSQWYEESAHERGIGIAVRSSQYLSDRMTKGMGIIALHHEGLVGFCYIETWSHNQFVANSGLIIKKEYRGLGLGKRIKLEVFTLARESFPNAKVFGITTSPAVMDINSSLGYKPVSYQRLTKDESFWSGCTSCPNADILHRTNNQYCLCTAMLAPSLNESMSHSLNHLIKPDEKNK